MPELPEVETIRRGLQKTIVGKTIKSVEVRLSKIISIGPKTVSNIRKGGSDKVRKFQNTLKNQKIESIKRRAKMLIIDLVRPLPASGHPPLARGGQKDSTPLSWRGERMGERLKVLIHLKMTGQLIFAKKSERKEMKIFNVVGSRRLTLPHQYTHVIFNFADGSRLYYNDLRQFGYIRLIRDEEVGNVKELQEYGPEPLSRDYTFEYLAGKAKTRKNLSVKQFIVDPKVVAGVGNIYSDEILYCARVRPDRKVAKVSSRELKKIFHCVPKILKEAVKYQGSSVGDYFRVDGTEGRYGRVHRVYGRAGQKCGRCHSIIKSVKLGGRTSSYCPICQK